MKKKHLQPVLSSPPAVLLIDDDPIASSETQSALTEAGYRVTAVANGDAALKLMRSSPMRLVVSELYIECMECESVIAALKTDRSRIPRLGVIVHSRHKSPVDVEYALGRGADVFVRKPAKSEILLREVQRLAGPANQ
jgi:CheY-like chemotaxis protein